MKIPTKIQKAEIEIKKSRFIAVAYPCNDLKEIKNLIAIERQNNPGARHVVHAAVIGSQFSCSDDKEPKNTAGRPALEVLKGSGITNIAVLIIRYFGGTLLGTGGLVKAYSDSVKEVLKILETEELIDRNQFSFSIDYSYFEQIKIILENLEAIEIEEKFESIISITGKIPVSNSTELEKRLSNLSNGKIKISFSSL